MPKLIAAAVIAKEPARYGFALTPAFGVAYLFVALATAAGVVVGLTTFCAIVGGAVFVRKVVVWVLTPPPK